MIDITLSRLSDLVKVMSYIGDGELLEVHKCAEDRVNSLSGLKVGDEVLVKATEAKTGNSINTVVKFNLKAKGE